METRTSPNGGTHPPLQLDELIAAMQVAGIEWEAGETEITPQVRAGDVSLFGLSISEEERVSLIKEAEASEPAGFMAMPAPPPVVDWRDMYTANWVTPVRNQRQCGSCVAFSTCAVLESRARLALNDATYDIDLSEAHLFFCGAGMACGTGWNFVPALQYCRDEGVGIEADFPYTPNNQSCQYINSHVFVRRWDEEATELARRQAIAQNGPVIAGMKVFEDFAYYKGGIYRHVAGRLTDLHAVAVVGYNDEERYWIIKNSWGTSWGEGGFFRMSYGECGLDTQFPFFDPEVSVRQYA